MFAERFDLRAHSPFELHGAADVFARATVGRNVVDDDFRRERLPFANVGGQGDSFDRDFGTVAKFDRDNVDSDAICSEQSCRRRYITDVFVSVGYHDDATR